MSKRTPLTNKQLTEMLEAAKPLMKWMDENLGHPHYRDIVDTVAVELVEGVATNRTEEFLRD
jgi:hypothetical protein